MPRNTGKNTPAGWKQLTHDLQVFLVWMDSPDDPAADMGPESVALSGMLTHLASTVSIRRCSVSGVCSSLPLISLGALAAN